jgi:hypothetical protein
VCNKWQPIELKDVEGVVFVKTNRFIGKLAIKVGANTLF